MLFPTHLFIGIVFFLILKDFFNGGNIIIFFFLVLLGSILPDIDSNKSKINRWSGFIGIILAFFTKHRGIYHSILTHIFLFFAISFFFQTYYASALFIGYLAHLTGDAVTRQGVVVFYPFSKFKLRGPVKVGSFEEGVIMLILTILIVKELFF